MGSYDEVSDSQRVTIVGGAGGAGASASESKGANVDSTTLQNAATATGNGTALNVQGFSTVLFAVTGTFVGTVVFEGQGPDDVWYTLQAKPAGGYQLVSSVTTTGAWFCHCTAYTQVRARISAYTSGSITVVATNVAQQNHADTQNVTLSTTLAGEDLTANVMKMEQRFSYTMIAADTAVKSGAGFLHSLTFAQADAAPTAGTIIAYDNTAESGTKIFDWSGITTAVFYPTTVILDVSFATGLYLGFTTTADVNVTVAYR